MRTSYIKTRALLSAGLLASILVLAQGWPTHSTAQVAVPPLTGHVIDQTGTLTAEQKATLEQTLTAFEARKGTAPWHPRYIYYRYL